MIYRQYKFVILVFILALLPISAKSQIKSATGFVGECTRKIEDIEDNDYCDSAIVNLNFEDGYVSFQFNSKEKLKNGRYKESISFVGPGLSKQKENGKEIIYLPVEQLTFGDGRKTKLDTKKVNDSVCLLGFSSVDLKPENLRFIQCHYKQGSKIIVYKATNLKMQEFGEKLNKEENKKNRSYRHNLEILNSSVIEEFSKISCVEFFDDYLVKNPSEEVKKKLMLLTNDSKHKLDIFNDLDAIVCECKTRSPNSFLEAYTNVLENNNRGKIYNSPRGLGIGLSDDERRWREKFRNWREGTGQMPQQTTDGLPTCALKDKDE
jgi:hypothetical protein